jgi:hypothetical protein
LEIPYGNADRFENKGVAKNAVRKGMKPKGRGGHALFIKEATGRELIGWENQCSGRPAKKPGRGTAPTSPHNDGTVINICQVNNISGLFAVG